MPSLANEEDKIDAMPDGGAKRAEEAALVNVKTAIAMFEELKSSDGIEGAGAESPMGSDLRASSLMTAPSLRASMSFSTSPELQQQSVSYDRKSSTQYKRSCILKELAAVDMMKKSTRDILNGAR